MHSISIQLGESLRPTSVGLGPLPRWRRGVGYALLTSATAIVALYVAMWLQLETPRWAMFTVIVVSPPSQGDAMRKSVARLAGTPIGCIAAIALTALFPQNPAGNVLGLSIWMGGCAFIATRFQGYAAYAATLAGFTVAIVGINTSSQPLQIFYTAADRGAETIVGVVAAMMASVTMSSDIDVLDGFTRNFCKLATSEMQWIEDVFEAGRLPIDLPYLDAVMIKLPAEIAGAQAERPVLGRIGIWVQGLPTALIALQGAALELASKKTEETQIARNSLCRCQELLSAEIINISSLQLEESRLAAMKLSSPGAVEIIDSLRLIVLSILAIVQLRPPVSSTCPFPPITLDRPWAISIAAFARTALGICAAFAIWDATAWDYGNVLMAFSALLIAAITIADDSVQGFRGAVTCCAVGCVSGVLTLFLLLPLSDSFSWLALVLLPLLAIGPWMQAVGYSSVQGILFAVGFITVLSPTNPQQYLLPQTIEQACAIVLATIIVKCVFAVINPGGNGGQRIHYYLNALQRSASSARSIDRVDRLKALTWQTKAFDQFRRLQAAAASPTDRQTALEWILKGRAAMR